MESKPTSHYRRPGLSDYWKSLGVTSTNERGRAWTCEPKVSIVTTTFNSAHTLGETIDSVRRQAYPNIEYVIVDGSSTDGTENLVEANRDVVTTYLREPDDGIYDGINKGIALSRGDIVKITNADDLLTPNSIENAVKAFKHAAQPNRTVVNSFLDIIDGESDVIDLFTDRWIVDSVPAFLHPSWYVPIDVYRDLGLYALDLKVASDYEYFLYSRQVCEFVTLQTPLAAYRTEGRSSGFEGMHEAIEISKKYLSAQDASKIQRTYWMQKFRKRILYATVGERGFYAIKRLMKRRPKQKAEN